MPGSRGAGPSMVHVLCDLVPSEVRPMEGKFGPDRPASAVTSGARAGMLRRVVSQVRAAIEAFGVVSARRWLVFLAGSRGGLGV